MKKTGSGDKKWHVEPREDGLMNNTVWVVVNDSGGAVFETPGNGDPWEEWNAREACRLYNLAHK